MTTTGGKNEGLDPHLWQKAASVAARFHAAQMRKDGRTPYVSHPFRVAMVVRDVFEVADEVVLAAALLHDVIEDTTADYEDVSRACGTEVADLVVTLTKDMRLPEKEREPDYDRALRAADRRAKLIKLADVYDNLCDGAQGPHRKGSLEKARRALEIAESDGAPSLRKPVQALRQLIERVESSANA